MFSTLLTNLQTLISSRFLVASFIPCLVFWFVNAALLYFLNAPFHDYVLANVTQTSGIPVLVTAAALIGVALFAYAEFALLPALQALLEGNWPSWIVAIFAPAQAIRYEWLEARQAENRKLRGPFRAAVGGQTQAEAWRRQLLTARQIGAALPGNAYHLATPNARRVQRLARLRRTAQPIASSELNLAVAELTMELRANNADRPGPDNDFALDTIHQSLLDLIAYADEYAAAEYRSLVSRKQFSFGSLPLAPTRMGNVARTVQAYAIDRYEFNFELLWSRLQLLAQRDKDFSPILQAAKTQLDFLVSCSVLTFAATLPWLIWLPLTQGPAPLFLAIALLGPTISYVWYRVAVAQYRTLADLLRSTVDLFRLDLLAALHYPIPDGVEAERFLWEKIDALHLLHEVRDLKLTPPK